jgi:hypothetical protein
MAKFLAVHTLPISNEQQITDMGKNLVEAAAKIPNFKGLNYKLTYCAFGDHKFFCEWDAPTKEALEQGFKAVNISFDAVYPVKIYEGATGKWS